MQVRPGGIFTLKPGRKPPLISIFSTRHMRQVPGTNLEVAPCTFRGFHRAALESGLPTCRACVIVHKKGRKSFQFRVRHDPTSALEVTKHEHSPTRGAPSSMRVRGIGRGI